MIDNKLVYIHRRLDTDKVFYVGMGNNERPYKKSDRNSYWHNVVNKVGYYVDIIAKDLCKEDALELEMFLISEYGRDCLTNMTDGGEHNEYWLNKKFTKEHKAKISEANKGRVKPKDECDNIRLRMLGHKSGNTGKKFSKLHKNNLSKAQNRKPINQLSKENELIKTWDCVRDANRFYFKKGSGAIFNCLSGRSNTAHGFKWTYK